MDQGQLQSLRALVEVWVIEGLNVNQHREPVVFARLGTLHSANSEREGSGNIALPWELSPQTKTPSLALRDCSAECADKSLYNWAVVCTNNKSHSQFQSP